MSAFWPNHQAGILFFVAVVCLISLSNLVFLRRLERRPPPGQRPRLSALVPARDEERNIERCVRSLLGQKYPNFEVLVLDDHSQDGTRAILARLAREDPRLRVLQGQALPQGWLGKPWACHQLGEAAGGELLLFADADTFFHPLCFRNAVSALLVERADLLSAIPYEETCTWGERLIVPLMSWALHSFLPVGLAQRVQIPALSAGVGQFLLFRRTAYTKIGGFAAVKDEIADDSTLARRVKAHGLRWRLADGTRRISCRMYHSLREACLGFSRSLFAAFGNRLLPYLFVWIWLGIVFLEPAALLLLWAAGLPISPFSPRLAAAAVLLSLLVWVIPLRRFHYPAWLALLYPVTVFLSMCVAGLSLYQAARGQVKWKGRPVAGQRLRLW
jgi:chlorobactene glucosyltransferase